MSASGEAASERPLLSVEDVTAAALTIGAGADFAERGARLVTMIRAWAEPSAVVAFVRDAGAEAGLRGLPEVSFGHVGQGHERAVARLVEQAGSARLAAPWLIPPPPAMASYRVKALDSWLIPWSAGRHSGFLLLRGIAAPYPPNLAQAVALAAQGVWPLLPAPEPEPAGSPGMPVGDLTLTRLSQLEDAARTLQALCAELRQQQAVAAAPEAAAESGPALRESVEVVEHARRDVVELREQCEALDRARAEALSERDQAQVEATSWRIQAEALRERAAAVEASPAPGDASAEWRARLDAAEQARVQAESERDALRAEAAQNAQTAAEQTAQLAAARAQLDELRTASEARPDEAEWRTRLEAVEQARVQVETERDALRTEATQNAGTAAERSAQLAEARAQLAQADELRVQHDADRQALEGTRQALKVSEEMLAAQTGELESVRRQRANLQEQVEAAQRARAAAEAERDRARAEVNPLWGTIESLQRQLKDEQTRRINETAALGELQARHERAQAQIAELQAGAEKNAVTGADVRQAEARAQQAEARAIALQRRWDESVAVLRAAYLALKRTPFVPPTLRLSFAGAQALFEPQEEAPRPAPEAGGKRARMLLLDRDTPSLEPLAAELEAEGVDVVVAHYADEAAFFLKTPEARQLTSLVADVMAFRSDAELLERFRVWRLEMPALALVVSYRADDAAESERARRLPLALGAGHVPRPLARQPLLDALALATRRATRPTEGATPAAPVVTRPPARR